MPERILIFANTIAGRGRGGAIAHRLEAGLRGEGYAVHLVLKRPAALMTDDLGESVAAAIIIGGDGTVRAVADRLIAHWQASPNTRPPPDAKDAIPETPSAASLVPALSDSLASVSPPPLLIIPLGTANLMGRHLGIAWQEDTLEQQVIAALAQRRTIYLDAGRANERLFLLMIGIGFDAAVVHELDRLRKGPITMAHYVLPAALALRGYQYPPLRVEVDGREVFGPLPGIAFVGNIREYGTGFPMLPKARPDDGLLDVCIMPCRSPFDLVRLFVLSLSGDHLGQDGVVYVRGRHVRIKSPNPVPVQIDGDAAGHTPVTADLLPIRLPFIVP